MRPVFFPVFIAICVLMAGCGSRQDTYSFERGFFAVQKKALAIINNPEATPPAELKNVVDALMVYAKRDAEKKAAVDARFIIAKLYLAKKEYAKVRETLAGIRSVYAKNEPIRAEVVFMEGQLAEDQGDWDQALTKYQEIMHTYFKTPRGMEIPIYIAMHYKEKLQPDKMIVAFREAESYYTGMAARYPRSQFAYKCMVMTSKVQAELKEWPEVVKTLEAVIAEFKDKVPTISMRLDIANIYGTRLNDKATAQKLLQKIIDEDPKAPAAKVARAMLDNLSKEKP